MSKTESYLGFARKAGRVVMGRGSCEDGMKKGKIKLLLLAEDMADDGAEKLSRRAEREGIPCLRYGSGETLSHCMGTTGRYAFGITDAHFAEVIASSIENERES